MAGSPHSLSKGIFTKCYRQLQSFLRKKISHRDVDDIIQTAFYRLVKADQLLLPPDEMLAWLYRVAGNASTDLLKKRSPVLFGDYTPQEKDEWGDSILEILLLDDVRPEDQMLRNLFWREFESALAELPEEQRMVFERTELLGESYKSLSNETGIAINTLISRKHYAVLRLRTKLEALKKEIFTHR